MQDMKKTNLREVIGGADTADLLVEVNELGSLANQELQQVVGGIVPSDDQSRNSSKDARNDAKSDSENERRNSKANR